MYIYKRRERVNEGYMEMKRKGKERKGNKRIGVGEVGKDNKCNMVIKDNNCNVVYTVI